MHVETLTRNAFREFGDVIEKQGAHHFSINHGFAERYDELTIATHDHGSEIKISIFEAKPRPQPIVINMMERHPLGSQAFYPLQNEDWLVVVCQNPQDKASFRCFRATGNQGVNYARNVWHFPLLVFSPSQFIIVDRKGGGNNLEEIALDEPLNVQL